jgi:hypothetical protein
VRDADGQQLAMSRSENRRRKLLTRDVANSLLFLQFPKWLQCDLRKARILVGKV